MIAAGYIRISTEKQSEYSLEYQERTIADYCGRNNLALGCVFKDDGYNSYTFDRPDFIALEAFLQKNKQVKYLIIFDYDRFSRNLAEALLKIRELESKHDIRVYATNDTFGTDFTEPTNFLTRAFRLMMAESELHNIRKRTKQGLLEAALQGRFAHAAPFGYINRRDTQDRPILLIHEAKGEIVRQIFREYLNGMPIEQIRAVVTGAGFKLKGNSAVTRILMNPLYCGLIVVPEHKGRKSKYSVGVHAPLISEQDFWLAQDKLIGKKRTIHSNEEVPLRGVLHCWCGRKVTAGNSTGSKGKSYWYYLCPEHRQNLSATKLHDQFYEMLDHLSISEERMQWLREQFTEEIGKKINEQGSDVSRLTREIKSVQLQIKTAERKYLASPAISEETFHQVITGHRADEARLQKELAQVSSSPDAYFSRLETLLSNLSRLREAFLQMPLAKQHQFIEMGFDGGLSYRNGSYRTQSIHPLLEGNLQTLSDKNLLKIESPVKNITELPLVPQTGATSNLLKSSLQLLELIA